MIRKISLTVVLVIGVVWVTATFIFSLWSKGPAVDRLTKSLKPAFSNAGIAQARSDVNAVNGVITDLTTHTIPLLANDLRKTPAQVESLVSSTFPTVGKMLAAQDNEGQPYADGQPYIVHAADYLNVVATSLKAQQHNFDSASAIPTKNLPTVALSWLFLILGLVALGIGGAFIWKPDLARALGVTLVALGLVVVVVTFLLDVPGKTQSVDGLTNAFRPVFATTGPLSIDEGQKYLDAVTAADKTLETQFVPAVAGLLQTTPTAVAAVLTQASPQVVNALFGKDPADPRISVLAGILNRFDGLAAAVKADRPDFRQADSIPGLGWPTTIVQFLLVGPALILVLAGIGFVVPPVRPLEPVPVYGRRDLSYTH